HAHTMNETRATLRDVAVTATGAVSVLAGAETKIRALAAGGGLAGQVAVTGSAVSGLIKNAVVAEAAGAGRTLEAASLAVTATDESTIESLAGNVSGGMQAAVGGAFSNAVVMNQVTARLAGYDVGAGAAEVRAQNASNIKTAAVTAGFAGTAAVQGSFVNAMIMNETAAEAVGGASIAGGSLTVRAADTSAIDSLGGTASASGTVSIGAALLHNLIKNTTRATLRDYGVQVAGTAAVEALSDAEINNLALAAAFAGNVAVAGGLSSSEIVNETAAEAQAAPGVLLEAGELAVEARDRSELFTSSWELGAAGTVTAGGALANNVVANRTAARLDGFTLDVDGALSVLAGNVSRIRTTAASAGAAGAAAVKGSVASAHIHNETEAFMGGGSSVNGDSRATVQADDRASITTIAGAGAVGGTAGVGGTVAVNTIGNRTAAGVRGSAGESGYQLGNLVVRSDSGAEIAGVAAAAAGGAFAGVAGSVATNVIDNETEAFIDGGALVTARNNAGVIAESHDVITNATGTLGIGIKGAGVGASVTVNMIGGHTKAFIAG